MRAGSVQRRRKRDVSESETAEVVEWRRWDRPSGSMNCFLLSEDSPDVEGANVVDQDGTGVEGDGSVGAETSGMEGEDREGTLDNRSESSLNF